MAINPQVTARVDPEVRARIDRCVIAANEANPANPIERGGMVRILLLRALPEQEAEYGLDATVPKKGRAKNAVPKKGRAKKTTPSKRSPDARAR